MFITKPKVKDLMAFLAGRDPEPLLLIGGKYSGASTRLKRPSASTKWMLTEHLTMAVGSKEDRDGVAAGNPDVLRAPDVRPDTGV